MTSLLEVKNLEVSFRNGKDVFTGVSDVTFHVNKGEILCIVGESGSGKSITTLSVMGLLGKNGAVENGSILFDGVELFGKSEKELDNIRGSKIAMIFQDALTSLNPVFTIGNQMLEAILSHSKLSKKEAEEKAKYLLGKVGLSDTEALLKKYPHTLSGGMRQRVMIAMALAGEPKLLIADEPTTALDVTIQAQIMELLKDLNKELDMSVILITHDMGVVAEMADRVLVMYAGEVVEEAPVNVLFHSPGHPYTKALLRSIPGAGKEEEIKLVPIEGTVPEDYDRIEGCRFLNRCTFAEKDCALFQDFRQNGEEEQFIRCWKYDKL
ncbi:ABC transporter ATP-binding protein [Anaerocolumna xylanovorans]|uniref:Oligopeptide transport system ATP-binding protein n=1 Tax=Anaerocolumna xylanovorans DSM 12503 TaxID=1121345 RepID=A0A1M7XZF0_9FIRM|nr:ABC transporter ATP-binding protein [Anaerocolumna xylanovorans]SHO44570.1 oligopeptide transport system ATP-binding protein [Anaerocolumna xylanovorans DSM 12503]